jgi:protein TonB
MAISLPPYPRAARAAGQCGSLMLALFVSEDSRIARVEIAESSGYALLDQAAAAHARQAWRLVPGTVDGKPVGMWSRVRVTFELDRCKGRASTRWTES